MGICPPQEATPVGMFTCTYTIDQVDGDDPEGVTEKGA
jgi:hypothetical protein